MADEPKKTVEVDASTLTEILRKLEDFEAQKQKDDKTISKLLAVADKGRLANYEAQHEQASLIRTARISMWEGSIILGWKTIKNEVGFQDGVLRESQTVRLFLLNSKDPKVEKHVDVDLLNFNRQVQKQDGEIVKDNTESKSGKRTLTVKLADGMEIDFDVAFVN